jgi:hypothetical protein
MVATVFINWAATALASASKPKTIKVSFQDGSVASINTGTIQFGQARDFMVPITSDIISITMDQQSAVPTKVEGFQLEEMARFDLINSLKKLLEGNGSLTPLVGLYDKYKGTSAEHLMSEIKADGQVVLGTQPTLTHGQSYWTRWGRHYIPAYLRAHELQHRMNFRDGGLQKYGSTTFEEIQTLGDHVFGTVDPFEPTGTMKEEYSQAMYSHRSPTSTPNARSVSPTTRPPRPVGSPMMSLTSGGGAASTVCWAPGSLIKMADGSKKPIDDVRKGDLVWTIAGPSLVEYAIEFNLRQTDQPMVQLGDLLITPWHPVLDKMVWRVPADLAPIAHYAVQTVYNLVLAQGHIVEVGGVLTVTLGHGFKGSVIEHAYFGNKELIMYDLASQPGFAEGRPVYKNVSGKKKDGLVVGWFDDV